MNRSQTDKEILRTLVPGDGDASDLVREQILTFSVNLAVRNVLLLGPIGAGKSTIARVIAVMRYLCLCNDQVRSLFLENLKFDGPFRIDKRLLSWYEELNLTGLTES